MPYEVLTTPLLGLVLLERQAFSDHRGQFRRLFDRDELASAGWDHQITQVNWSHTRAPGSVRGIHFQHAPHADAKLVSCVAGAVWDVAVDLRKRSPTFLCWHAELLTADNGRALLIPEGFGHGFQALEPESALIYVHSSVYAPDAEGGIHPLDPALAIRWPSELRDLSQKDANRPFLEPHFQGADL